MTGTTPNEDAELETIGSWVDTVLLKDVRETLSQDYGVLLDYQEIQDIMYDSGIDFGYETEYSVADLIWESMHGT
jgi:hypothetical protein